jgi:hypothetical protein
MAKRSREIWISCCLVTAFSLPARAQAITEYGGVSRQSATTTGRTIGPGKEIRGVWTGLDRTIKGSDDISGILTSAAKRDGAKASGPNQKGKRPPRAGGGVRRPYSNPTRHELPGSGAPFRATVLSGGDRPGRDDSFVSSKRRERGSRVTRRKSDQSGGREAATRGSLNEVGCRSQIIHCATPLQDLRSWPDAPESSRRPCRFRRAKATRSQTSEDRWAGHHTASSR